MAEGYQGEEAYEEDTFECHWFNLTISDQLRGSFMVRAANGGEAGAVFRRWALQKENKHFGIHPLSRKRTISISPVDPKEQAELDVKRACYPGAIPDPEEVIYPYPEAYDVFVNTWQDTEKRRPKIIVPQLRSHLIKEEPTQE